MTEVASPFRALTYWALQVGAWGAWTLLNLAFFALQPGPVRPRFVAAGLWLGAMGLVASHGLRVVIRRRGYMQQPAPVVLPRLLLAVIVAALVLTGVNLMAMIHLFGIFGYAETRPSGFLSSMAVWVALLTSWVSIYSSLHYFEQHRRSEIERLRLEVSARDAQLGVLRAQLNPHFIFNCLNSIRALVAEDPERAQAAITRVAHLLRQSLQSERVSLVTLREEMETVEDYLQLEALRYEDRLRVATAVLPAALDCRLPPMLLQTLVENAIKHGIARRATGGELRIEAASAGGELLLRVVNTGRIGTPGDGTGLANARRRLQLLYGTEGRLTLAEDGTDCVVAEVRVPDSGTA